MFGMSNMYGMNTMFSTGNMFGNCGFGGSIFGGYGFSPFMDCNGYTNYNTMAGYAIGNTLMSFANLGINYAISGAGGSSKKDVATNLNADLDSCLEDIEEKLDKLGLENDSDTITAASLDNFKTAEVEEAEEKLNEFSEDKKPKENDAKYKTTTTTTDDNGNTTTTTSTDTKKHSEDLENWEKNKEKAEKAVEAAKEAQEKLLDELKELIKERDRIKTEINETILDNADGSKAKHRNTALNIDNIKNEDGTITNITQKDISQLIYLYRNAANDDEKKTYAEAMKNIDNTAFSQVASNDQYQARKIMLDWLAKQEAKTTT